MQNKEPEIRKGEISKLVVKEREGRRRKRKREREGGERERERGKTGKCVFV